MCSVTFYMYMYMYMYIVTVDTTISYVSSLFPVARYFCCLLLLLPHDGSLQSLDWNGGMECWNHKFNKKEVKIVYH